MFFDNNGDGSYRSGSLHGYPQDTLDLVLALLELGFMRNKVKLKVFLWQTNILDLEHYIEHYLTINASMGIKSEMIDSWRGLKLRVGYNHIYC